ncbi:hypothetical protein [Methanococcoides sp. FTZ1]|uniref:hypothetical protein n=1 Tax=Methanococcoides sp. FTZ1 TaxID=3439061 RepID=UPI003F854FF4
MDIDTQPDLHTADSFHSYPLHTSPEMDDMHYIKHAKENRKRRWKTDLRTEDQ